LDCAEEEDWRKADQKYKESTEVSLASLSDSLLNSSSGFVESLSTDMSFFSLLTSQQF
jgi:hypothetical protein